MPPLAGRCPRLVSLLAVLLAVARSGDCHVAAASGPEQTEPPQWQSRLRPADVGAASGPEQTEPSEGQSPAGVSVTSGSGQILNAPTEQFTTSMVESLLRQLISRIDGLDSRLSSFDSRLNDIEARLNRLESKQDVIASDLDDQNTLIESADTELDPQVRQLATLIINTLDASFNLRGGDLSSILNAIKVFGVQAPRRPLPRDCSDMRPFWRGPRSGIYLLKPDGEPANPPVLAYCDLETDGGGWTVIQRRRNVTPRQDFNRNWTDYREGFGDLRGEFWWGLQNIWKLTGSGGGMYELLVNLEDFDGEKRWAAYSMFSVGSEAEGYRLIISGYQGNAGDSLGPHNDRKFSTADRDQDRNEKDSCASWYEGGWWFSTCYDSFLNGPYRSGEHGKREGEDKVEGGIHWKTWKGFNYSLKMTEMKIRPANSD